MPDNQKDLATNNQYPPQIVCPLMSGAYAPEEDEINLIDLFKTVWKYKWMIISLVVLTGIGAVFHSLSLPNIYRSDATIIPREQEKTAVPSALAAFGGFSGIAGDLFGLGGGGSLKKFETVLKSRIFANKIYEKHRLEILPTLYKDIWDPNTQNWKNLKKDQKPPTIQDVTKAISNLLTIITDKKTSTLSIQVENEDPEFAKKMVDYYLSELSDFLRQETLKNSEENQRFLREQLDQTLDVLLKEKIYVLLAKEIEKETFARAQNPYSFQILDPPIIPDLNKKVKPKRARICMISVVGAGFMAVFIAFFIEFVKNAISGKQQTFSNDQQTRTG